jgi:hypothetical protein
MMRRRLAEYWLLWLASGDGYECFVSWLEVLKRQVSKEIASIWRDGSKRLDDWYRRAGGPEVERTLTVLVKEGAARARGRELKRLEARTQTPAGSGQTIEVTPKGKAGARKRLRATVTSPITARRMEAYIESKVMSQTSFANQIGTTDRTLRKFRKTGKIRRDIFHTIAKAIGIPPEEALLKPE